MVRAVAKRAKTITQTNRDLQGARKSARAKARGSGVSERASSRESDRRIQAIRWALETVTDPEIPTLNVVEMGMIADVRVEDDHVVVDVTPTFAGCPALDLIRANIRTAVTDLGESDVTVHIVYDPPWTTDRISETGHRKLKEFGLAPPQQRSCSGSQMPDLEEIPCPYCDSSNTELESLFGPTLCRSIHYCHDCLQSFEHFKAV